MAWRIWFPCGELMIDHLDYSSYWLFEHCEERNMMAGLRQRSATKKGKSGPGCLVAQIWFPCGKLVIENLDYYFSCLNTVKKEI